MPSASNITMPSAVVSRMAPSSSASAWPAGSGSAQQRCFGGVGAGSAIAAATAALSVRVPEKIRASAESPSQEIV